VLKHQLKSKLLKRLLKHKNNKTDSQGDLWLFVGLGNPGPKYAKNRHNIGFEIINDLTTTNFKSKFQGMLSDTKLADKKIMLLKPMTFMNNSGQSVGQAAKFYKIPTERIVVFHDELDLEPGQVKVKLGGGNAGHNGLKSMQAHLGTPNFWRVRLGIGHPGDRNLVSNYVLSDFAKKDQGWIDRVLQDIPKYYEPILEGKKE
jgi:PTH1 family peptidyl-tRNA hydrolase